MGWRFQKRIRLLPGITLNLSRKGVSTSIGTRGARVTLGHGKRRTTVGIPGSGISHTSVVSTSTTRRAGRSAGPAPQQQGVRWRKIFSIVLVCLLLAFVVLLKEAWAVNKCTGPDGKVVYQQTECTGTSKAQAVVLVPNSSASDYEVKRTERLQKARKICGTDNLPLMPEVGWSEKMFLQCSLIGLENRPDAINATESASNESKQYVFRSYGVYIYTRNGVLTTIQKGR